MRVDWVTHWSSRFPLTFRILPLPFSLLVRTPGSILVLHRLVTQNSGSSYSSTPPLLVVDLYPLPESVVVGTCEGYVPGTRLRPRVFGSSCSTSNVLGHLRVSSPVSRTTGGNDVSPVLVKTHGVHGRRLPLLLSLLLCFPFLPDTLRRE